MTSIYLDNNATTRVDPRVIEAMLPYFGEMYGNAASHSHAFGWAAEEAVEKARGEVAALIGAEAREIVWTSGATESDNLAVKGVMEMFESRGDHLITCATEHKAVLDAAEHLERQGKTVTLLPVDQYGQINIEELREAITERTVLVSVMLANNEIGTLQPITEIGRLCHERGIVFHTDATQAMGKVPVDVQAMHIDLLSMTAHKMHGPKGIGALYVRRRDPRIRLTAQMDGGGHERGFRSGTLNVPGIVGFGKAAQLSRESLPDEAPRLKTLRDRLHEGLADAVGGVSLNGHPTERLPNTVSLSFRGVEADAVLAGLSDVALSSGSACSSASVMPSHVLKALGLSDEAARSSVRFGVSRFTTDAEIDYVLTKLPSLIEKLRRLSSSTPAPALAAG